MLRGGGQGQQHALRAQLVTDRGDARARHDQPAGCPAKQPAHRAEAVGAGHEHRLALAQARLGASGDHPADRLIARHKRVTHSGERRHPAGPQQALGAGADPAPGNLDNHVADAGIAQGQTLQVQILGGSENDG